NSVYLKAQIKMEVKEMKKKIEIEVEKLKGDLAKRLEAVRSGQMEATSLHELFEQYKSNSICSPDKVTVYLEEHAVISKKISFCQKIKSRGGEYVQNDGSLDGKLISYFGEKCYIWYTNGSEGPDYDRFEQNKRIFFQEIKNYKEKKDETP